MTCLRARAIETAGVLCGVRKDVVENRAALDRVASTAPQPVPVGILACQLKNRTWCEYAGE